jgi:hypothetical protein
MLFLTLADPILRITLAHKQKPQLFVVFDGTDSMAMEDAYSPEQQDSLYKSLGITPSATNTLPATRSDFMRSLLTQSSRNVFAEISAKHGVDLQAFVFEGATTSKLRKLDSAANSSALQAAQAWSEQLTTRGQVTALGAACVDITRQADRGNLAGVILVSDFAHNSGPAPLGEQALAPSKRLGVPLYTVGIGNAEAVDIAVDLQLDPKMKKAERTVFTVKVRQSGLDNRTSQVFLKGRKLSSQASSLAGAEFTVGMKSVALALPLNIVEFPYTPDDAGRYEFWAEVEKMDGEIVEQNNRALRETQVIDDYLRLLYVANEPNWEWRFVKEVFHRDKLVGMEGFRTFLGSSDPRVRESNVLFLPSLTPKRSDFFANDVIFLADMPRASLNDRFCDMVREYVGNLGGGLVVIAGPEFGLRELQSTPLADMLPVVIDPQLEIRSAPRFPEFPIKLTPHASRYGFMQLGTNDTETAKAWRDAGKFAWYQPVAAVHDQAVVLAEYPASATDAVHVCRDGKTPQPIIAVRPYGKGEVVYIACNEMWRLRRKHGEKNYRAFWSQLIYRLGMSHAMGHEKRFVARLDQPVYQVDDKALLTVEVYDENYEPITEDKLTAAAITAELLVPDAATPRSVQVPLLRPGTFETKIPVTTSGEYGLRITDPITRKVEELRFEVRSISAERRRATRDIALQQQLAEATHGKSYDLTTVHRLVNDLQIQPKVEFHTRNIPLWATPWWFGTVVGLLLFEWLIRKFMKLI